MAEIDTLQIKIQANAKSASDSLRGLARALDTLKTSLKGLKNGMLAANGLAETLARLPKSFQGLENAAGSMKLLSAAIDQFKISSTGMKEGVSAVDKLSKVSTNFAKDSTDVAKTFTEINQALENINISGLAKLEELTKGLNNYADALKRFRGNGSISQKIKQTEKALSVGSESPKGKALKVKSETAISNGEESEADIKRNTKEWAIWYSEMEKESKKAGEQIKKTTGLLGKFAKSIGRIMLYRAIRSALKGIAEAFSEGLKNAYYYSKQTGDLSNLAKTLDEVKSKTSQMVNQLGAFWGEIKQFFAPAIEWIAEKIRSIVEYLTELFAALNGDTYYQRAKLVAQSWDEAADAADKYKHQLLGIDELNVISKKNDKSNDPVSKAKEDFEDVLVRPEFRAVGEAWQNVKQSVSDALDGVYGCLIAPVGMAAIGAILLFTGHTFLGLGLILTGVAWGVAEVIIHWDELRQELKKAFKKYWKLFAIGGVAAVAVGALLIFTSHYVSGIALVLAGTALLTATIAFNWDELKGLVKSAFKKYKKLFVIGGVAAVAIGALLIFTQHYVSGIALVIAGTGLLAATIAFNWDDLKKDCKAAFKKYKAMFAIGSIAAVALGVLLLFTPMFALGIGLIVAGTALGAATVAFNWDDILESIKQTWKNIKAYLDNTVFAGIRDWVKGVRQLFGLDTPDFTVKDLPETPAKVSGGGAITIQGEKEGTGYPRQLKPGEIQSMTVNGVTYDTSGKKTKALDYKWDKLKDDLNEQLGIKIDAIGGINKPGTLFYAGEAGPEFVGSMGSTSAVANTGQMTDAIRKAAYLGMRDALAESGNGLAGYEPATTDDLFIAMRKKATNYNRMTGNSAFA